MSMVAARSFKEAMGREWLTEHRNRFVVAYYDLKWYIFRVEERGGVNVVLKFYDKEQALEMSGKLNDMYEEGKII